MPKSAVRGGVYAPPEAMLPYVGLVITPEGVTTVKTFPTEEQATEFVEKQRSNYVAQLSVIGKGIRDHGPEGTD
ncbi:MAG: hypothetical protein AAFV45_07485 [Pseudomonadota bacterium]